jgi:hypothetical protein
VERTGQDDFDQRVVHNLRGGVDQLQNVGLRVIVPEEMDALVQARNPVLHKLQRQENLKFNSTGPQMWL